MPGNDSTIPQSITALSVEHGLLLAAKDPELSHLVKPDLAKLTQYFYEALLPKYSIRNGCSINRGNLTYRGLYLFPMSVQKKIIDNFGAIGFPQHIAMRKLLMEEQVQKAIEEGARQVLIVGSGYDVLVERLHNQYPEVTFIELDRGETLKNKIEILESFRKTQATHQIDCKNAFYIHCDLSKPDWYIKLCALTQNNKPLFDPEKKSIAILEGLTMYLTMEQNVSLLTTLRDHLLNPESKIVLGFNKTNKYIKENKSAYAIITEASESLLGELTPQQIIPFTRELNLSLLGKASSEYFQELNGNGEIIKHCDPRKLIVEDYYLLSTQPPSLHATQNINAIPDIHVTIPPRFEKQNQSYCIIM